MKKLLSWSAIAAAIFLTGCSSEPTGTAPDQLMAEIARGIVPTSKNASGVRDISELNRAAISGVTTPFALIEVPDVEVASTVIPTARKGSVVTWRSPDGGAVLFDGPVLFASRGIGDDLLSAETSQVVALLAKGQSGSYERTLKRLTGLNKIEAIDLQCRLQREGRESIVILEHRHSVIKYRETCTSDAINFNNFYWLDSGGFHWKSTQWIGIRPGSLTFQRLVK